MALLKDLHKTIQEMYEVNTVSAKLKTEEKKWLEGYIINFSLLTNGLIDYDEFLQRCLTEQVVIQEGMQEEHINTSYEARPSPMKPFSRPP